MRVRICNPYSVGLNKTIDSMGNCGGIISHIDMSITDMEGLVNEAVDFGMGDVVILSPDITNAIDRNEFNKFLLNRIIKEWSNGKLKIEFRGIEMRHVET